MRKDGKRNSEEEAGERRSLTKSANEFLSGKPCSKPKVTVNSSQIGIADGNEESEEESKGNVENVVSHLSSNSTDNNKKATKC